MKQKLQNLCRVPNRFHGLTQNQLKLFALFCMTVDHIGYRLLPDLFWLRYIGRLAFPIFSYAVFEGCHYTRHLLQYLARLAGLGIICMGCYYLYSGEVYGNILLTFSLSAAILSGIRMVREGRPAGWFAAGAATLVAAGICQIVEFDYGFGGVLAPVYAGVISLSPTAGRRMPLLGFAIGLTVMSITLGDADQYLCLLALPLLALANGTRGRRSLKYLFYLYYPAHLVLIELIAVLISQKS